jgi:hypothetical protein
MYELNFIWVGPNKMPEAQLANLDTIKTITRDSMVRVWITEDMHPELKSYLQSKGYILEDISQLLDRDVYPKTSELIDSLRESTLPSGLGDILKFLILTRKNMAGLPTKRFYLEADNDYRADMNSLVNQRPFMYEPIINPYTQEIMAKPDVFYIDTASEECVRIMENGFKHVEILLSDQTVYENLKQIILLNKLQGFTHESAVIRSFGMFPSVLCKSLLTLAKMWDKKELGNKDFASRTRHIHRSWKNPKVDDYLDNIETVENKERAELISASIEYSKATSGRCYNIMNDSNYWLERAKDLEYSETRRSSRPSYRN